MSEFDEPSRTLRDTEAHESGYNLVQSHNQERVQLSQNTPPPLDVKQIVHANRLTATVHIGLCETPHRISDALPKMADRFSK